MSMRHAFGRQRVVDRVDAVAAGQLVGAAAADQHVVAGAAVDLVVAAAAVEAVGLSVAFERVGEIGADQILDRDQVSPSASPPEAVPAASEIEHARRRSRRR